MRAKGGQIGRQRGQIERGGHRRRKPLLSHGQAGHMQRGRRAVQRGDGRAKQGRQTLGDRTGGLSKIIAGVEKQLHRRRAELESEPGLDRLEDLGKSDRRRARGLAAAGGDAGELGVGLANLPHEHPGGLGHVLKRCHHRTDTRRQGEAHVGGIQPESGKPGFRRIHLRGGGGGQHPGRGAHRVDPLSGRAVECRHAQRRDQSVRGGLSPGQQALDGANRRGLALVGAHHKSRFGNQPRLHTGRDAAGGDFRERRRDRSRLR